MTPLPGEPAASDAASDPLSIFDADESQTPSSGPAHRPAASGPRPRLSVETRWTMALLAVTVFLSPGVGIASVVGMQLTAATGMLEDRHPVGWDAQLTTIYLWVWLVPAIACAGIAVHRLWRGDRAVLWPILGIAWWLVTTVICFVIAGS